jgi:serine/threonine-protein kinase
MTENGPASRYEVLGRIASGGMATVYLARMRGAGAFSRLVALKKPNGFVLEHSHLRKQLQHEARVASMIHHPNVVSVLDVVESDGEVTLVMDYIDGCTLKDLLSHAEAAGEHIPRAVVRIVLDVAAGLHAAHSLRDGAGALLGVVHRDVSPHNMLVGRDGIARLTDFGIAKIATLDNELTATDAISGKLAYLAPEYLSTKHFDAQSDLFSLGVVTWEGLARERLFQGATPVETMQRVLHGRAPLLGSARPELLPLEAAVNTALATRADERQASVRAFADELEAAARAVDGVASHAEVAALVERLAATELAERKRARSAFEAAAAETSPTRSLRDDIVTQTLVALPAQAWQTGDAPGGPARASSRRARRVWGTVALLTLIGVAGSALLLRRPPAAAVAPLSSTAIHSSRSTPPSSASPIASAAVSGPTTPQDPAKTSPIVHRERHGALKPQAPSAKSSASAGVPPDALPFPQQAPPNPYGSTAEP